MMAIESSSLLAVTFKVGDAVLCWFLRKELLFRERAERAGISRRLYEVLLIQDAGNFAGQDWNLRPFQFFWRLKNYG
jgi:hypothetical protein